jgi:cytochrome P450
VLLQNTWSIEHDPKAYDQPDAFEPERYLDNPYGTKYGPEQAQANGRKPIYAFGTSRRQCPGDIFSQDSLIITMAKLVWTFDITVPEPLDMTMEKGYHGGLVAGPEPFQVSFAPRTETHRHAALDDYASLASLLE